MNGSIVKTQFTDSGERFKLRFQFDIWFEDTTFTTGNGRKKLFKKVVELIGKPGNKWNYMFINDKHVQFWFANKNDLLMLRMKWSV